MTLPEKWTRPLPWLGLALIIGGLVAFYINGRFATLETGLVGGGALLVLLYVALRPNEIRELMAGRTARFGTSTLLSIIFVIGIFGLLYWVALQNESWRIDVSEDQLFTPRSEVVELLQSIDEPIHVIGFFSPFAFTQQEDAELYLRNLQAEVDNLTFEMVDPEADPIQAERYGITLDATLVFIRNQDAPDEIFTDALGAFDRDREVFAALTQLINPVVKKAYFITGHGEFPLEGGQEEAISDALAFLRDSGFEIEPLALNIAGSVPEDADVIALVGAQLPLQDAEVAAITEYVDGGGSFFLARDIVFNAETARIETDGIAPYLADSWGIQLREDVIVDPERTLFGQPFAFAVEDYGSSSITLGELQNFPLIFFTARSIGIEPLQPIRSVELARTGAESWGETDLESQSLEPNAGVDNLGPLVVALEAENRTTNGRLVVIGESGFMTNQGILQGGNSLFVTNAFNWLARDEAASTLTPRDTVQRQVVLTQSQLRLWQVISLYVSPLLVLLGGGYMWFSRRQKATE